MTELLLFTDGSVNTRSGVGYGAYLAVEDRDLPMEAHRNNVKLKRFESTSSTKLELQTLLWALSELQAPGRRVIVHTDSQNITGLQRRRGRLEKNDFRSKGGKRLNNYELYQEFYRVIDSLDCEIIQVRGHRPSKDKDALDNLFTLVDRASRNALRT
jgi:ribonuclease HI